MKILVVFCVHRAVEIESWNSWTALCLAAHKITDFDITLKKIDIEPPSKLDIIAGAPKGASINRCRSYQMTEFYDNPTLGDIMVFLDDDVVYDTEGFIKLIRGCIEKKSVVSGVYPTKGKYASVTVCSPGEYFDLKIGANEPLHRIKYAPGGFLAIHRDAVNRLMEAGKSASIWRCGNGKTGIITFFLDRADVEIDGYIYWFGEDYSFCHRCLEAGIDIWVDPSIWLAHVGKKVFTWDDMDWTEDGYIKLEGSGIA